MFPSVHLPPRFRIIGGSLEGRMEGSALLIVELVAGDEQLHLGALRQRGGLVDHITTVLDSGSQRAHAGILPRFRRHYMAVRRRLMALASARIAMPPGPELA